MRLSPLFEEALQLALAAHKNHLRKGTQVPYVSHLLAVAAIVLDYGGDEDEAIAALLHDSVEDCGVDPEEIRKRFGDKAANIVVACSDSLERNPDNKPDWRPRKEAYIEDLKSALPPVLLVSAADKLHNVRSIVKDFLELGHDVWLRFKGGKDGSLWYYQTLVEILKARGEHRMLVDELARTVAELRRLASSTC
jgi:(p)ppGpp synthase/HD superfamily hydrolase